MCVISLCTRAAIHMAARGRCTTALYVMAQASSQAWAFYRDVAEHRVLWPVRDARGYPAPVTQSGRRAQPFWSARSRAERIIKTVPAYAGFVPEEISWERF